MRRIYWRKLELEPHPKSGDQLLWLIFETNGEEYRWLIRWDTVDQLYVLRHFVQQGNMLSQIGDKTHRNGYIGELAEELSKALKNVIERVNEAEQLRTGRKFIQTPELRKELTRIFFLSFLAEGLEEGEHYERYVRTAQIIIAFDTLLRRGGETTKRDAVLAFLRGYYDFWCQEELKRLNDKQVKWIEDQLGELMEEKRGEAVRVDFADLISKAKQI